MRALLVVAAVVVLAGCGTSPAPAATPSTLTVDGSVLVRGSSPQVVTEDELTCVTGGGYTDVREGAQVVVTDAAGKTIGLGLLGAGSWKRNVGCIFLFTVSDVPVGQRFYGVEVSHRGRVQYAAAEMSSPIEMSIG